MIAQRRDSRLSLSAAPGALLAVLVLLVLVVLRVVLEFGVVGSVHANPCYCSKSLVPYGVPDYQNSLRICGRLVSLARALYEYMSLSPIAVTNALFPFTDSPKHKQVQVA